MKTQVLIFALLLSVAVAFYDENSSVVTLTADNFKEKVLDTEDFWLVEFYAPWCGHCKKLTPEWERAAKGLKGIVSMGAVDMTTEGEAGKAYDVQGYPTLKFFGEDKEAPQEYEGGRTSVGIINFATRKLKEIANTRIGNKKRAKPEKKEEPKKEEEPQQDDTPDDVIVITDANFQEEVEESKDAWFIEFYAPWCGHCKNLTPTWKKLATSMKGKAKIAKVDATENGEIAKRFGVNGYPSLKFFPGGVKSDDLVEDYNGGRDLDALERFTEEKAALSLPAKFTQLVSQETYEEYCVNIRGACIVVFLPHLVDSSLEERKQQISYIQEVADDFRGKPFTFLWSEGGQQYGFEDTFSVGGSGYPSVLAISVKKSRSTVLRGAFTKDNLAQFVTKINSGKQSFGTFNTKPVVKAIDAWNGEDIERKAEVNEDL